MKTKYSLLFSNRRDIPEPEPEPEKSMLGIYPSLKEFKNSHEEIGPVLRNMNANLPQKLKDDRDRSYKRSREMEGSLALQAIKKMKAEVKEMNVSKTRGEPKKAPIILMKDNLTKAKRAPKQLCPTGGNIYTIEKEANLGEQDVDKRTKLREALIKKSRDYPTSFPKYNGDSKQGQTWFENIC